MERHPHIQVLHHLFLSETQPFRKVHRMIDLFESLIKFHTVVILSEYVKHNRLSDNAKFLLAQGLYKPSLGVWKQIGSALFKELEEKNYNWLLPDFPIEFRKLDKALEQKKTNVIEFRNYYGHGATPPDEQCEAHIQQFEPFLNELLQLNWLKHSSILVRDAKVFLSAEEGELSLHPVLIYREEKFPASLAFFNDLKNDKIGLLNYPLSKYYREKNFYDEFQNHLPLRVWKKSSQNLFDQQIEELTESFKGREQDLEILKRFVRKKNKGYLSVLGNPGIGKSTLIAQFIKELRANQDLKNTQVIDYFIHRGRNESRPETLLNYLIQKTDEIFREGRNIRQKKNDLWHIQEILFEKWKLWSDHCKEKKLLILIDGLDEGVENKLTEYLPRENFENVLIIYGSRPGGHPDIIDFWPTLPVEYHMKLELRGLSKENIRALIYEVGNKYEIEKESKWIDTVLERSNGYPLYLKLLCDAIENGSISLNNINALPKEINNYYEAILRRYSKDKFGNALLSSLFTLAAAKDELSISHLRLINQLDYLSQEHVSSTLREILVKNETSEVETYQLFHETFREFLMEKRKLEIQEAEDRILDFCASWEDLEGTYEQRYALQHYASHLIESKKSKRKQELLQLLNNKSYIQTQKQVLRQFEATRSLLQIGLAEACKQKNCDIQLETALSLVDLEYEETNEAPQIIEMVANGEIELALKRIESFGGQDEEGLKRKFILYMLCLAELTVLKNKVNPLKNGLKLIIAHLDNHIPRDTSLIDWNIIFPNYLIFQISLELEKEEINSNILYKRTGKINFGWIPDSILTSKEKILYLIKLLENEAIIEIEFQTISIQFAKRNLFEFSLHVAGLIKDLYKKVETLTSISSLYYKSKEYKKSEISLDMALATLLNSKDDEFKKQLCLRNIFSELHFQNKNSKILKINEDLEKKLQGDETEEYILSALTKEGRVNEAVEIIEKQKNNSIKAYLLEKIGISLIHIGKREYGLSVLKEATEIIETTTNISKKIEILVQISNDLFLSGEKEVSKEILNKVLKISKTLDPDYSKNWIISNIVIQELLNQGEEKTAVKHCMRIKQEYRKIVILSKILQRFPESQKLKIINSYLKNHDTEKSKDWASKFLSIELSQNEINEIPIRVARLINSKYYKTRALIGISMNFSEKGKHEIAELLIKEALAINFIEKGYEIKVDLANELSKLGKENEAVSILKKFLQKQDFSEKSQEEHLINISTYFIKHKHRIKAIRIISEVNNDYKEIQLLKKIGDNLSNNEHKEDRLFLYKHALKKFNKEQSLGSPSSLKKIIIELINSHDRDELQKKINITKSDFHNGEILSRIASELVKENKYELALKIINKIKNNHWKIISLIKMSNSYENIKNFHYSEKLFLKALNLTDKIQKATKRNNILKDLCIELSEYKRFNEALYIAEKINFENIYEIAISEITIRLVRESKIDEAVEIVNKKIKNQYFKSKTLKNLSSELNTIGLNKESEAMLLESLKTSYLPVKYYYQGIEYEKIKCFLELSNELLKRGKEVESGRLIMKSLKIAENLRNNLEQDVALKPISIELANQNKMEMALEIVKSIKDENYKADILKEIFPHIIKANNWHLIIKSSQILTSLNRVQEYWINVGNFYKVENGWKIALQAAFNFESNDIRFFYLRGWAEAINACETNQELLQKAIPYLIHDTDLLEIVLQKYAIHETFLGKSNPQQLQRLNQTLNIQWALDIVDSFSKESETKDLSIN